MRTPNKARPEEMNKRTEGKKLKCMCMFGAFIT